MEYIKKNKKIIIIVVLGIVLFAGGIGIGRFLPRGEEGEQKKISKNYKAIDCIEFEEDYNKLEISIAVSKEDIDAEIDSIIEQNVVYEQKSGNVADGDMIYANIVGYIDGKRVDDACTEDFVIIGSGDWLEGFEDALIGIKTGTTAEFTISVPNGSFGDKDIDGHDILYNVKVEYICGDSIVPEYNDEFVQSISNYDTTEEYTAYIKEKLLEENNTDRADYAWTDVMDICKVKTYPEDMLEKAKDTVLQGYYDMAELYGCSDEEIFLEFGYTSKEEFMNGDLEELAKDTVKEQLLARAIASKENISYTQEEYDEVVEDEYYYYEDEYSSKEEYEKDNREELEDLALMNVVKKWMADNLNYVTNE